VHFAALSPLARSARKALQRHMIQHDLPGDIAPLPGACLGARSAGLHPLAALVAWCGTRAVWHVPRVAALERL
jgi:cytochrome c oxidase assembly factor CtaG